MTAKGSTSRKRFGASYSAKPLDSLVFFVDRCLGSGDVPDALRAAGMTVERMRDHFDPDVLDHVWIEAVGKKGWIILTKDEKFRSRQLEIRALINGAVPAFVLASGNTTGPQNGAAIVSAVPQLLRFIAKFQAPFLAQITAGGAVGLVLTHEGLMRQVR